ncbi:alkylation response protein AidB-like acyl-CoA dehydrogenase [Bradyrhizobium sp. AZCC 2262]
MDVTMAGDVVPSFGLSDDQRAIYELARDFGRSELAPKALEWDREAHFPIDVLRRGAELGFGGIYIGEKHGGSGLCRLDATLICEALAEGCPTISAYFSIHNMATWMIDRFGGDEQRARWVPRLCTMELLASYCLTEPSAGSDAPALKMRAIRDGGEYILDGSKQFISGAGASDVYVIMARTADTGPRGVSAFVVEKGTPGLSFGGNERKMGWNAQPTRQVVCENLRIPGENRLGAEGDGFKFAMAGLDGGRLNIGACSVGGAQAALDKAIAYVEERTAFGRKIGELSSVAVQAGGYGYRVGGCSHAAPTGRRRARSQGWQRHPALRDGQALRYRYRQGSERRTPIARRLRLSRRIRGRKDRAGSAGAPNPRRYERDHARHHRTQTSRRIVKQTRAHLSTTSKKTRISED